ncbi:MAG TPA: leishmanolysin-related zinc metalloendopeptidase [Longimicrobium sp.]|jgi:hypothetical protein|nr:leishmanolysin-related zinc metalloendopeptidase [Longimicrobium sp.]
MNRALPCTVLALFAWGCSGSGTDAPKVATTVLVTPPSITFDAVGATQVVHASVKDQTGGAMTGVPIAWSSSSASATVTGLGGDSAVVTSAANGTASITATGGAAAGSAAVQVAQVAAGLQKVSGDLQAAAPGAALPAQILVRVVDRLGAGIVGQTVTFTVTQGSGSLSSTSVVSGADGIAATSWTLGGNSALPQTVSVSVAGVAAPQFFNATAVAAGSVVVDAGNDQGAMAGTTLGVRPSVLVKDAVGNPAAGRTVTFAVASGGGSVTGATAITNASGIATVGSWTIGAVAGPNTLTATVTGTVTNNPVVFRAVGCQGGGGAGYGITLCFTTTLSATQRAVFETAAARWQGLITADVDDVSAQIPAQTCGGSSPSLDLTIDDLVIFAGIEDIDGPGQVLGSAGPCYIRDDANALPVVGVMRFDLADVIGLESGGQLGSVILHEMGHVLGIGSMWSFRGLLKSPSSAGAPPLDTYFSGVNGIAGFDAIGGTTYTLGQKVPVENTGGAGTANSHWRESVLKNELMTGYLNNGSNPLSVVTVRSLQDLGYTVNVAGADPLFLTLALRAQVSGTAPTGLQLENDVWTGPRYKITRHGRRTLLPQ